MKQLRNLLLALLGMMFLTATPGLSQGWVQFSGTVTTGSQPAVNYPVNYQIVVSPNVIISDSIFTNPNGYFISDSIFINSFLPTTLYIFIQQCNGGTLVDSLVILPTTQIYSGLNYQTCPANSCNAQFIAYPTVQGQLLFAPVINDSTYNYFWTFGDGTTSTQASPLHTYSIGGTYTTCLTISGNGCVGSTCQTFYVQGGSTQCDASLALVSLGGNTIQAFSLDTAYQYTSYRWFWGNGAVTLGPNPTATYTYSQPGNYAVCLTVFDSVTNCTTTNCDSITVGVVPFCQASYTFQTNPSNGVQFFGNGANPGTPYTYLWSFGDSTTGIGQSPFHQYTAPGTYWVCLTVTDSSGCTATSCQYVIVQPVLGNCSAAFSVVDSGSLYFFIGQGNNSTMLHFWDPGDGSGPQVGTSVFTHQFATSGNYNVCHYIYDQSTSCFDSICTTIQVGQPIPCSTSFAYTAVPNAPGQYLFTSFPNPALVPVSYQWTFGNGASATGAVAVHAFAAAGVYPVCLTVTFQGGCVATYCDTVNVFFGSGNSIAGLVITDSLSAPVLDAVVYLIQYDSLAGSLTLVDSQLLSFPFYYAFQQVTAGSYLVKAALLPTDPAYASYLPTYFGDEMFWYNAQSVVLVSGFLTLPPITLIQGVNPGGPGFIGGLVSQGANKTDEPMGMISVLLMNANNEPVASALTNASGEFSFPNLPYGTYYVYLDIAGKYGEHWTIVLDGNQPSNQVTDFTVTNTGIFRATGTAIADLATLGVRAYPNPFQDQILLEMENVADREVEVRLVNMSGQVIVSQTVSSLTGQATLETGDLPAGVYLLYVKAGEKIGTMRMVRN